MKYFLLAACIIAVAFAAPNFRRGKPPKGDKPSKEDVEELILLCEDLKDDKRGEEPALEEVCKELAKLLENGPKPTDEPSKRADTEKAGMALVVGLNTICVGFNELVDAYERLGSSDKRSWDGVMAGLKGVCDDLYKTQMAEVDTNGDGELQEEELNGASSKLLEGLLGLCAGFKQLGEQTSSKRSWETTFMALADVCVKAEEALLAQQKRQMGDDKPTKEEVEELIALCEALKDDDKREDEPELEEVCRELAKMLEKGPKPTEPSKRGKGEGRRPPKTDEDGNTLPPPTKDGDMPTKEEVEELIALCEMLKDDDKREDEPELEEVCRELAKMLKKGPKPTETSKRGKGEGRRPPKTDEDGNTLPPPTKDGDMPTKEEVEELIALCEMLKDDDKREDEPELEEICRELAKMLEKGPKPTEPSKRGKGEGRRPPKTDEDGNTLPPPTKDDDMPTKEEVEELIALCEMLKDDDKREDEPELEEVCRELAKMLKKGPKPTEPSKRGKGEGRRPPKTDEDGNTLPPPTKDDDMPTKEEVEELIALCEMLKDDDKREDEPELEEVCKELAKMLEKGPKPTEPSKRGKGEGRRPPKTDEDGNTLPPPTKDDDMPTKEEVEELIALCEMLKDDDKREDEPELEEVCKELAKMLKKGPKPTEPSKRGKGEGRRPPKTDEDGNTLPPPTKGDDMPTKEEVEELIALCEMLKDDDKREDEPELEEICRELAKMLENGPKPTEPSKRGKGEGRRPPKTDEDGNTLPPPTKGDDMPTKEEVEELIALCEMLKDDDKREDEPELEEVCKELAKMLKKGPKPTPEV